MSRTGTPSTAPYGELVRQYIALRDAHPGVILLARVGAFYEVLFDDAELVARELGLKLSERPSGGSSPPVPQCGFAHHALDTFLSRLLARGYRVAVGDEHEEMGTGVRRRAVVRTLTPGTVTDPVLLREDRPTYLVGLLGDGSGRLGLAWLDAAAGEFGAGEFDPDEAAAEVQRLDPAEILVPSDRPAPPLVLVARHTVTPVSDSSGAEAALSRAFPDADLADVPLARAAAGLVVAYLATLQGAEERPPLDPPRAVGTRDAMRLDAATQRHLELVETERGRERGGSLLGVLDRTTTPMGRRMLRAWLLRPLTDLGKIATRQRIVAALVDDTALRTQLGVHLAALPDLERLAGRLAARRATTEDLAALATVAAQLPELVLLTGTSRVPFLRALGRERPALTAVAARVVATLAPADASGPVRPEASPALAAALAATSAAAAWQADYIADLRRLSGLGKVQLSRTSTQGLFLEVPVNTPVPATWIRRGGLQRVERYTTAALDEHAAALAEAEATASAETRALLDALRDVAAAAAPDVRDLARYLASADVSLSLALIAAAHGWVRPHVDDGNTLAIEGSQHPVLALADGCRANDVRLVAGGAVDQLVVLTGPNMAGKSTWMRQVALLVILAQIGSFVPAVAVHIGLVDAIFTRIGAVDDLAGGRSTFMVEMLETAAVLRGATDRSLVLLDELGRGTSTHDGLALAWAVIEGLVTDTVRPRTIAATHYHELATLAAVHPAITLLRAAVDESMAGITFPHRIEPGAADRSFGIEVARLAGLPPAVLARAREVAAALEPISAAIVQRLGDTPSGAGS